MKILTAGYILGLFEESFQKFGYMYIIGDQRAAMVHDYSVERSSVYDASEITEIK